MTKTACIIGISGQDGLYLAQLLLNKGYEVHGGDFEPPGQVAVKLGPLASRLQLHQADVCQGDSLVRLLREVRPQEVYNLAAQSCVAESWRQPVVTGNVTALGVARLLEAIRVVDPSIRLFHASSSEIFGTPSETPQCETTLLQPCNPYGTAKVYAHCLIENYREGFDLFACSGILYNHESPRRGPTFVTRKITLAAARIKLGLEHELRLGNVQQQRDWGFAGDYVRAMWLMLQQDEPKDYVIGTGIAHSVQDLVEIAFSYLGLDWQEYVVVHPSLYRPNDAGLLLADASLAREKLGWRPTVEFAELVRQMVDTDLRCLKGDVASDRRAA